MEVRVKKKIDLLKLFFRILSPRKNAAFYSGLSDTKDSQREKK